MSNLYRELTPAKLLAAQTAVRGMPTDIGAFADLLGIRLIAAELLLRELRGTTVLDRVVLANLLASLKRVPLQSVSIDDIDDSILTFRLMSQLQAARTATDLAMWELDAVGAAMRDETVDAAPLSSALGASVRATLVVLAATSDSPALDVVLTTCLLMRLHGVTADLIELHASLCVVFQHRISQLHTAVGH